MALKIAIKNDKGITTEYHMISEMVVMADRIQVKLKSYTDADYRQLEKDVLDNMALKEGLEQLVLEEMVKEEPDETVINTINEQIAALDIVQKDYSVDSFNYRIPFSKEDEISYAAIYEKLKEESTFADAEDC